MTGLLLTVILGVLAVLGGVLANWIPRPSSMTTRWVLVGLAGVVLTAAVIGLLMSEGEAQEQPIDLIAEADKASWRSGQGAIQWASGTRVQAGTAGFYPNAPLESGVRTERALSTHPQWVDYGYIEGDFRLSRQVRKGDRFVASVGFFAAERCFLDGCRAVGEADFTVYVMGGTQGDTPRRIFTVHDVADDWRTPRVDVDLSPYAGATTLRIRVDAGSTAGQDWAGWWDMKIDDGR